jgi:hypothetical protein
MDLKTFINQDVLLSIAREAGCTVTEKKSYFRLTRGTSSNSLCVRNTRDVHQVDVNGFVIPGDDIARMPKGGVHGPHVQDLNFSLPEAQVLANFRTVCQNLDTYPSIPKKERSRPGSFRRKKEEVIPGPSVAVRLEETVEQHAERLIAEFQKKREVSNKMGFPLSARTVEEFKSKVASLGYSLPA